MKSITPTSSSSTPESKPTLELRLNIDVRVSISESRTGTTVPLGHCADDGIWTPLDLGLSATLDRSLRDALIEWLTQGDIAGTSVLDQPELAVAAVAETRQRCLLLAEQRPQTT